MQNEARFIIEDEHLKRIFFSHMVNVLEYSSVASMNRDAFIVNLDKGIIVDVPRSALRYSPVRIVDQDFINKLTNME